MASKQAPSWGWSFRQSEKQAADSPEIVQIKSQISRLKKESRDLLADMQRQNAYDSSRGLTPGKFREHFTVTCTGNTQHSRGEIN